MIILLGSLIGLFGYRGSVTLGKGETKDSAMKRGSEGTIPLGFAIKLDDFKISFYPSGEPKEYVSRIEIIDKGKTVDERQRCGSTIPSPTRGRASIRRATAPIPSFVFDIGGEEVRLSQGSAYKKGPLELMAVRFERSIHNFGPGVQLAYLEGGETKTSWFVKDVPRLREKEIMGVPVRLDGIGDEFYTGLEVVARPWRMGRLDGLRPHPLRPLQQLLHVLQAHLPPPDAGGRARRRDVFEEQGGLQGRIREMEGKGAWH